MKRDTVRRLTYAFMIGTTITFVLFILGSRDVASDWIGWLSSPGLVLFYIFFPTGIHSGANMGVWVFVFNAIADSVLAYLCLALLGRRKKNKSGPGASAPRNDGLPKEL